MRFSPRARGRAQAQRRSTDESESSEQAITDFKGTKARFIGLQHGVNGVDVEQGDTIDEITALDEDLRQSDRYLEARA